jgi:hypothetical protein
MPPSPSFWPQTTPTDDFRAGGAALVVRNNTSPHVSMARFGLKRNLSKMRFASVSILNFHRIKLGSGKSARRAVFVRKQTRPKEKTPRTKKSVGDGKEASARHPFPPTIVIDTFHGRTRGSSNVIVTSEAGSRWRARGAKTSRRWN